MQGKIIFSNRKALHDYEVVDTVKVGIALYGWEVKSLKAGHANFQDAYVSLTQTGELMLHGSRISGWKSAPAVTNELQNRDRKLLAKRSEAARIGGMSKRPGFTAVILSGFISDRGLIKLDLALVKGKKKYQKKQKLKERDLKRELQQDMRNYR